MVNSQHQSQNPRDVALAYVSALGGKRFADIEPLLAENMHFRGPGGELHSAAEFMVALRRLEPTISSFSIKKVFTDGDEVCVIYDYGTPTSVGALPIAEWLTVRNGKIVNDLLLFDRVSFGAMMQEVAQK